jgi:hypothetical protein
MRAVRVGVAGLAGLLAVAGVAGSAAPAGASQYAGLKKDLLVRSDFPAGWSAQGSVTTNDGGGGGFPGQDQLASCVGVNQRLLDIKSPTATSPNFQDEAGEDDVQDSVNTFTSTQEAKQEYAAVSGPKIPSCLTTDLQTATAKQQLQNVMKGVSVGAVTVTAANPAGLVPHSAGFTMTFPATSQGVSVKVAITVVSLVRGKTGTQLSFTAVESPFSTTLERHLVAVAYGRA